ncbi:uncharacterized protein [Lepeophtheirus salmonis]|uniref:uncharacterized protein n=1 Tax=Lepeophtheirus salmonis TaxID=72036 RepID=UPI001AEB856A|nr:uncharacterized protein LOC121124623 [Lepeophtheirus salmonis]
MTTDEIKGKLAIILSIFLFILVNSAMIIVGSIFSCPADPMISLYLIIAGSMSISLLALRILLSHIVTPLLESCTVTSEKILLNHVKDRKVSYSVTKSKWCLKKVSDLLKCLDILASVFSTVWLIIGSIYVYGNLDLNYVNQNEENYCDLKLYGTAFIVITIGYISLFMSTIAAFIQLIYRNHKY